MWRALGGTFYRKKCRGIIIQEQTHGYLYMKIENIDVTSAVEKVRELLKLEKQISPALQTAVEVILEAVTLLSNQAGLNSSNSSKPPSSDQNRERGSKKKKKKKKKKPGGQNGHKGSRLEPIDNPDHIEEIKIDRRTLPKGHTYHDAGYESRQVFNIIISRVVTEYQAEALEDEQGNRYVAPFPNGVNTDVSYGASVKSDAVYLSQFQLLTYNRMQDYFSEKADMPLSAGSLFNFNREAYTLLENFESVVKRQLILSRLIHVDETGINVNKKKMWLHSTSNALWTYFYPHPKRGREAMDAIGILEHFTGVLCHDHWKPYYTFEECDHSLCNAHHLRELECAFEQDGQKWANKTRILLLEINKAVDKTKRGKLSEKKAEKLRERYKRILAAGGKECPLAVREDKKPRRGRVKQTKSRNLLNRLIAYEDDVLRFMDDPDTPFTNNQGENDLRMTKVQQKISGCFRSFGGAQIFCRIRSYLSTCRKHGVRMPDALDILFKGDMPEFIQKLLQ